MSGAYIVRPFDLAVEAFNALHPDRNVKIGFIPDDQCIGDDGEKAQGFTLFPDDGSDPEVWINGATPVEGLPDTVAHELAHVVCGIAADHGPEWEAAYQAIWSEIDRRASLTTPPTRSYADEDVARIIDPLAWAQREHALMRRGHWKRNPIEGMPDFVAIYTADAEQLVASSLAKAAAIRLLSQGEEA